MLCCFRSSSAKYEKLNTEDDALIEDAALITTLAQFSLETHRGKLYPRTVDERFTRAENGWCCCLRKGRVRQVQESTFSETERLYRAAARRLIVTSLVSVNLSSSFHHLISERLTQTIRPALAERYTAEQAWKLYFLLFQACHYGLGDLQRKPNPNYREGSDDPRQIMVLGDPTGIPDLEALRDPELRACAGDPLTTSTVDSQLLITVLKQFSSQSDENDLFPKSVIEKFNAAENEKNKQAKEKKIQQVQNATFLEMRVLYLAAAKELILKVLTDVSISKAELRSGEFKGIFDRLSFIQTAIEKRYTKAQAVEVISLITQVCHLGMGDLRHVKNPRALEWIEVKDKNGNQVRVKNPNYNPREPEWISELGEPTGVPDWDALEHKDLLDYASTRGLAKSSGHLPSMEAQTQTASTTAAFVGSAMTLAAGPSQMATVSVSASSQASLSLASAQSQVSVAAASSLAQQSTVSSQASIVTESTWAPTLEEEQAANSAAEMVSLAYSMLKNERVPGSDEKSLSEGEKYRAKLQFILDNLSIVKAELCKRYSPERAGYLISSIEGACREGMKARFIKNPKLTLKMVETLDEQGKRIRVENPKWIRVRDNKGTLQKVKNPEYDPHYTPKLVATLDEQGNPITAINPQIIRERELGQNGQGVIRVKNNPKYLQEWIAVQDQPTQMPSTTAASIGLATTLAVGPSQIATVSVSASSQAPLSLASAQPLVAAAEASSLAQQSTVSSQATIESESASADVSTSETDPVAEALAEMAAFASTSCKTPVRSTRSEVADSTASLDNSGSGYSTSNDDQTGEGDSLVKGSTNRSAAHAARRDQNHV